MKKKLVITAALTAALMAAGAIGGTIAYFTSESNTTASIEAGIVRMSMEASNLKLYSLDVEQTGTFENGGTAELVGTTLTLAKMTPGDKVEFDLTLNNQSNVLTKYQVLYAFGAEQKGVEVNPELTYATAKLSSGLVISMKDANDQPAPAAMTQVAPGDAMPSYKVSIELPAEAGNEYQGAKSDVVFQLYGIQANKPMDSALALTYDQLVDALEENQKVELLSDVEIPVEDAIVLPAGAHIIGNGHKIVSEDRDTNVTDYVFEITGDGVILENLQVEFQDNSSYMLIKPEGHGFTLKGCSFTSGSRDSGNYATALADNTGSAAINGDVVIEDCNIDGFWCALYGGRLNVDDNHDIIVKNSMIMTETYTLNARCRNLKVEDSVIRGWTTFNNAGVAEFKNVTFSGSVYGAAEHKYNYLRCYSEAKFENCKFLENGDHEAGDGEGLLLEVVNGATATLTNCQVARKNALSTFIDIVADQPETFNFVTLKMHSTGATNGAGIVVNGVALNADNTPSLVW